MMRISSKRQIAIPKHIMTAMNLQPGDEIDIRIDNGAAYLVPVATIRVPRDQAWFWTKDEFVSLVFLVSFVYLVTKQTKETRETQETINSC